MKTRRFHNSIQASNQLMIVYNADCIAQEDIVLEILQRIKAGAWFQVAAFLPDMNQDSLKRSLSNLQERGVIVKDTDKSNMVMGPHGKRCHKYILVTKQIG